MSLVKPGVSLSMVTVLSGRASLTCNTDNTGHREPPTVHSGPLTGRWLARLLSPNQWFLGQHPAHTHSECCVGSDTETATIVTSAISQSSIQFIILVTVFVEVISPTE